MSLPFIIQIILIGISFVCYGFSIHFFHKANNITVQKNKQQDILEREEHLLQDAIKELDTKRTSLINEISECQKQIDLQRKNVKNKVDEEYQIYKQNSNYASQQYMSTLEKSYSKAELDFDIKIKRLKKEQKETEAALQTLKDTLAAGVQAQLREQEKEEKINFYKINISDNDKHDIQALNNLKASFHQPIVLNKLIWSTYYQKKTTEMCNRILGTTPVCGIYKITNLNTKQCYIGQSVNISDRWKQHCKCGCDIDASATNRLYQDMIKTGIENFSFELMEACERADLNEKEKFWINMYQSDIYGLNSTKGNK